MLNYKIIQNLTNPKNVGNLKNSNGVAEVKSNDGSEILKLFIQVEDNVIKNAKFKALGSPMAIAVGSVLTQIINDKDLDECNDVSKITFGTILGTIDDSKEYLVDMAIRCLEKAILNYNKNLLK